MMLGHRLALVAALDLTRHRAAHRFVEHGSATLGKYAHDVAFGDDAGEAAVSAEDERGADTLLGEKPYRFGKAGVRFDADDLAALVRDNDADGHR